MKRRTCTKKYHSTKEMAKAHCMLTTPRAGYKLWYYKCPDCPGYHLTKKKPHFQTEPKNT